MKSSIIIPSEELKKLLIQVGAHVTSFERKERDAVSKWLTWLSEAEDTLKQNNYSETSEIAGIRADIMAVKFGVGSAKEIRKQQIKCALESVREAQAVVLAKQTFLEEKLDSVRDVMKQIVTMAKQAGMIQYDASIGFTNFIEHFFVQLQRHEQLAPSINNAVASIGRADTIRILAEEIELT